MDRLTTAFSVKPSRCIGCSRRDPSEVPAVGSFGRISRAGAHVHGAACTIVEVWSVVMSGISMLSVESAHPLDEQRVEGRRSFRRR